MPGPRWPKEVRQRNVYLADDGGDAFVSGTPEIIKNRVKRTERAAVGKSTWKGTQKGEDRILNLHPSTATLFQPPSSIYLCVTSRRILGPR